MYVKCGNMEAAERMFNAVPNPDLMSWSIIISGYVQHALEDQALLFCEKMFQRGVTPDTVTFMCMLRACSHGSVVYQGRLIHFYILQSGFISDTRIVNALLDMYINCNSLKDA